jgi:hypothetical protein
MGEFERGKRLRASDADRDAILQILQDAHAAGRLTVEEVGERQDLALAAKFTDEFEPLVDDLPEGRAHTVVSPRGMMPAPAPRAHVPTRVGEERPFSIAVMSGRDIQLEPGSPGLRAFAWWGGHNIYLADAMGPGAVVVLETSAIMGGHEIYVPPGVRVVDETIAIMAGNDVHADARGDGSNGTLILRGFLFWAGSDVRLDPKFRESRH